MHKNPLQLMLLVEDENSLPRDPCGSKPGALCSLRGSIYDFYCAAVYHCTHLQSTM